MKATFEFKDLYDIKFVTHMNEVRVFIDDIRRYTRELEKYKEPDLLVRDGQIVEHNDTWDEVERTKAYIEMYNVIDTLNDFLSNVYYIVEE